MHTGLARLTARQHGLVRRSQFAPLGLTVQQVRWLLDSGELLVLRPRVYRLAGAPVSWTQTILAAVWSAGGDAVISHTTAAALWSLRFSDRNHAGIHMTATRQIYLRGTKGHRGTLDAAERTVHDTIPVTTPERTIVDIAPTMSRPQLAQCLDDAIRRDLVSLERLRRLVERRAESGGGRLLLQPVHKLLADRIPGYRPDDSHFETEMNCMWDQLGLPAATRQHRVTIDGHTYRLDRAIVEYKVAAEWDSYRHHSDPSDRDYDSNRRARLVADGWLIVPVTSNSEPELVARAVWRAYQDRGGPGR